MAAKELLKEYLEKNAEDVASDNDSLKTLQVTTIRQSAAHYLETLYANFDKDTEKTKTFKKAVAAPKPKAEVKDKVIHQNPFSTKMMARCPCCHKRTDVSKLSLDSQKRIKCPRPTCRARRAIVNWICTKCSTKETEARKDGNKGQVKIRDCNCYEDLFTRQSTMIIKCPDSNCTGRRHNVSDAPTVDRRDPSMRKKCDVCGGIACVLNWNCDKCSKKGNDIQFRDCACCEKICNPKRRNAKKWLPAKIILRCPRTNCYGKRACEEKDFPWLKKVRTVARYATCRKCRKRRSIWEWRCYTCNEILFNCKCKRRGRESSTKRCTPQRPTP